MEVTDAINSCHLLPTIRTQYMRRAFQIPYDTTVRISLDTDATMIKECVKDVQKESKWYRDVRHGIIPADEITIFPHAVLEIKLQLQEESQTPNWGD